MDNYHFPNFQAEIAAAEDTHAFIAVPDKIPDYTNSKLEQHDAYSYQVPGDIDMSWVGGEGGETVDMMMMMTYSNNNTQQQQQDLKRGGEGGGGGGGVGVLPQGVELSPSSLLQKMPSDELGSQEANFGYLDEGTELLYISAFDTNTTQYPQHVQASTNTILGDFQRSQIVPQSNGQLEDFPPPQTCVLYPQTSPQQETGQHLQITSPPQGHISPGVSHDAQLGSLQIPQTSPQQGICHLGIPSPPQGQISPGGSHNAQLGPLQIPQTSPQQETGHLQFRSPPQGHISPGGTHNAQLGPLQIPQTPPQQGLVHPGAPAGPQCTLPGEMGVLQTDQCIPQPAGQRAVPNLGSMELANTPQGNPVTQSEVGQGSRTNTRTQTGRQTGRRPRQRNTQPKAPKLYEIKEKLEDPVKEKKRRDAINSWQNRVKRAARMEALRDEVKNLVDQRDKMQRDVLELKLKEEELKKKLKVLLNTPPSSFSALLTPPASFPPTPSTSPPPYHSNHITVTSLTSPSTP